VGSGGNGTKLDITLASDYANVLDSASTALEEQLRTLQGIGALTSTASRQAPEIQITPDFARMPGSTESAWRMSFSISDC
ncbi:hypothetical protein AB9F35_36210, partial [Rhizobium leguminosarum]|uniref:hypothetical protein n=1 Tax=Rhizobium leguminosarum TaxID=384 RepID=UPI003F974372